MGFLPFRAFPSRAAVAPSSARCPLVVAADAEATATRLQGLDPHESPLDPLGVFTNWYPRCSLGAFSPSGLSPFLPWYRLRGTLLSKTVLIGVQSTIRGTAGLHKKLLRGSGEPLSRSRALLPYRVSTSRKIGLPLSSAAGPLGVLGLSSAHKGRGVQSGSRWA